MSNMELFAIKMKKIVIFIQYLQKTPHLFLYIFNKFMLMFLDKFNI